MHKIQSKNLQNKKICILGLGIENEALVKFILKEKINCEIIICDARSKKQLGSRYDELKKHKNISWKLGKNYDKNLSQYDIIFRIAGYPLFSKKNQKAIKRGVEISSATKLFFDLCPSKNIIGVTGTAGKGTTASLIYAILKTAGKSVFLGGNIGIPMFSFITKIKKNDWIVLELSSFQLEDLHKSPKIAVFTNFFQDHLATANPNNPNCHKSITDYWQAKSNIFKSQKKGDKLIINKNLESKIKNYNLKSKVLFFSAENKTTDCYFQDKNTLRLMSYRLRVASYEFKENIAAAALTTKLAGIKISEIQKGIKKFKGLPYRLEFIKTINKIKYYNDGCSKTPENTIVALKALVEQEAEQKIQFSDNLKNRNKISARKIILLVGGADKGSNFKQLAKEIKKCVKFVILLKGKATPKIKQGLLKINYPKNKMKLVYSMKDTVRIAQSHAVVGDIILLSPACASFGMFKNYKERGEIFKLEVGK